MKILFRNLVLVCGGWCGVSQAAPVPAEISVNPNAAAYYAEKTNFFRVATMEDLPADLVWQDGADQEPYASPDARIGGTLRSAITSFPPTLRRVGPSANSSFRGVQYDYNLVNLVEIHPNTQAWVPGLAVAWAAGADKKTAYFKLDPDARFTDGQPITVDDYFFTFFFMQSKWILAPWYNNYYSTEFTGITKFDDHTMAVSIPTPKPDPIYYCSVSPTPRYFYRDYGPDLEGGFPEYYQWKFEPKTGPYKIEAEDIADGDSIALTRVENWWGDSKRFLKGRWNPARREYKVVREADKIFQIFLLGEIDMFNLNLPNYWYDRMDKPQVRKGYIHKATFYNDIPRPTYGIYMNSKNDLLANRNIRMGLQHSIDWQRVIDVYFRGDYERMHTYNQGYGKYTNPEVRARRFDPKKARAYFAQAGFNEVGGDGYLRNADGRTLEFQLTMRQGETKKFLAFIVDSARRVGVKLRPEVLDSTTSYKKVMEKNHELVYWAWGVGGRYPRYWEGFHKVNAVETNAVGRVVMKRQTNNITLTADDGMSALIDRYRRAETEEQIATWSHQLQEMVHEDASFVPGYYQPWYRLGYWRWIRFPEKFDVKDSDAPSVYNLYWIDEERRKETEAAMKSGKTFEPVNTVYDQWQQD